MMVEFSNIFKKNPDEQSPRKPEDGKVDFASLDLGKAQDNSAAGAVKTASDVLKVSESADKKYKQAKVVYAGMVESAAKMASTRMVPEPVKVEGLVDQAVDYISSGEQELVEASFHDLDSECHYQAYNLANTCILSLQLGLEMGLSGQILRDLGIAAFLHDVGMLEHLDTIGQPRKLSADEFIKIKGHSLAGRKLLEQTGFAAATAVLTAVEQEHERADATGYPQGLSADKISQAARIIGFCDVYEALTHKRPWRGAYDPLRAIKLILKDKRAYEREVVKQFLERIGVCPRGAMVELNTREIARVTKHNPKHPMSPDVDILYDAQGKQLSQARFIHLSDKTTVYITKCI